MSTLTRLVVAENEQRGFFDPIQLCKPMLLHISQGACTRDRTALEIERAKSRALSKRVQVLRKDVVKDFLDSHGWVLESELTAQNTKRHPLCIHAALLDAFVKRAFPKSDHFVLDGDATWLSSRAPCLPSRPQGSEQENTAAFDATPEHEVGAPEHEDSAPRGNAILHSQEHESEGALAQTSAPLPVARTQDIPWWSVVCASLDDPGQRLEGGLVPPWIASTQSRLLTMELPFGLRMTLDPMSGLVRATDVAAVYNKQAVRWLNLGLNDPSNTTGTRGVAHALAATMEKEVSELVYCVSGANAGTWIHVRLMFHFAGWCHPPLAVHVNDIALRFYAGQLTTEHSQAAFRGVASTVQPCGESEADGQDVSEPSSAGQNRITRRVDNQRARIRDTAVYAEHLTSFDIPMHLSFATGVYIANFGIVRNRNGELRIHLKVGKAVEQPVTYRVRDHHNERPRTFQLTWMAGVDASVCWMVEDTMKRVARRCYEGRPQLEAVGNTNEEWLVPLGQYAEVHDCVKNAVMQEHRSLITSAGQVPSHAKDTLDIQKHRYDGQLRLLQALVNSGDLTTSTRAMDMLERMLCAHQSDRT